MFPSFLSNLDIKKYLHISTGFHSFLLISLLRTLMEKMPKVYLILNINLLHSIETPCLIYKCFSMTLFQIFSIDIALTVEK